jgi:hypothetical protein
MYDILDAAAFLEERSPQELLAPMIEDLVAKLAHDDDVLRTVATRRARRGRAEPG